MSGNQQVNQRIQGTYKDGNYSEFELDGTLLAKGNATTWTDFSVSANQAKKGANDKPDDDYTNLGLLFPQNNQSETISIISQMPHQKKMDSPIHLHIHYIQSGATQPIFVAQVRGYNNGTAVPSFSTIKTSDVGGSKGLFAYTSGSIMQIATFPVIEMTGETVSRNFDIIIYRETGDGLSGDCLVKFIDIHYEIDTLGSRTEFVK